MSEDQEVIEEPEAIEEPEIVDITIGEEPATEEIEEEIEPSPRIQEMRKAFKSMAHEKKEIEREKRRLEEELNALRAPVDPVIKSEKPTLENCYGDNVLYESELLAWYDSQREVQSQMVEREIEQEKERSRWEGLVNDYRSRAVKLNLPDFEDSENEVADPREGLSIDQQAILLENAASPEKLVYALGKNREKLLELKKITNPAKFAIEMYKMEQQMKIKTNKPSPEQRPFGGVNVGSGAGNSSDAILDKLMAQAEKTGDRTEVAKYRRQMRQSA